MIQKVEITFWVSQQNLKILKMDHTNASIT